MTKKLLEKFKKIRMLVLDFDGVLTDGTIYIADSADEIKKFNVKDGMGIILARKAGIKVGTLRLITCWPFPEKRIKALAGKIKAFVVPELNYGQMALEVERASAGKAPAVRVSHMGGWVHDPEDILKAIKEAAR